IPLPTGGPWGLHVYSQGYLYFPLQITVEENQENVIPVVLPLDGNAADDPQLSNIHFEDMAGKYFRLRLTVKDDNHNLGPQVLAIDARHHRSYRLLPTAGDLADKKAAFPEGEYLSPEIEGKLETVDKSNWFFVAADHQCSNGVIYNGLNQSIYRPPATNPEPLRCEIPGIWKSNFDKTYHFRTVGPDRFTGEQLEGTLTIKDVLKKNGRVLITFVYHREEGTADLALQCTERGVQLKGPFRFPASGRKGMWLFTKLNNDKTPPSGAAIFQQNCAVCHFADTEERKVGPGLLGLFQRKVLSNGKPVSETAIVRQIREGGGGMPPFSQLKEEDIQSLAEYLKTL
ncbi:MAG: cytochrome c, partial [Deltaproteobacteria bacterium]|nr:cytochrome c [Deltaproteobacteria bacterium]